MDENNPDKQLLDRINEVLFRVHNSYLVRREIHLHLNRTVDSVASKAYLNQINKYSGFFLPVLDSTQAYVITHLNRLVSSNDPRSLEKVINRMHSNGKKNYSNDLLQLRADNSSILSVITNYRMNTFAHLGVIEELGANFISEQQYIHLFKDLKILMNKLNGEYDSVFYYEADEDDNSISHPHKLLQVLLTVDLGQGNKDVAANIDDLFMAGRRHWFDS